MTKIEMHIFKAKLSFYPPSEVKCGLQNEVLTVFTIFNLHIIYLIFSYILQTHSSQTIHTYFPYIFQYILQTPYLTKHIYFLPSPYILKKIKHSSRNMLQSPSHGRHIIIMLKALLMKDTNL